MSEPDPPAGAELPDEPQDPDHDPSAGSGMPGSGAGGRRTAAQLVDIVVGAGFGMALAISGFFTVVLLPQGGVRPLIALLVFMAGFGWLLATSRMSVQGLLIGAGVGVLLAAGACIGLIALISTSLHG